MSAWLYDHSSGKGFAGWGDAFNLLPAAHTLPVRLQGALTVVSKEPGTVKRVESQLKQVLVWGPLPENFTPFALNNSELEARFVAQLLSCLSSSSS